MEKFYCFVFSRKVSLLNNQSKKAIQRFVATNFISYKSAFIHLNLPQGTPPRGKSDHKRLFFNKSVLRAIDKNLHLDQ